MNIIKQILTLPKTNGGKKRRYNLLNQLNIEKKDKNDIVKLIDSGDLGGNTQVSKLKSRKVCWKVDNEKLTDESFLILKNILGQILSLYPLYSSVYVEYDSSISNSYKYYGPFVNLPLCGLSVSDDAKWQLYYFEEAEDIENHYDGFMGIFKAMDSSITEEQVYEICGLKKITYEEYIALRIDRVQGIDYIQ